MTTKGDEENKEGGKQDEDGELPYELLKEDYPHYDLSLLYSILVKFVCRRQKSDSKITI